MPRGGRLSDESLRALERAAASDRTRTLEWTRALERAGRADEALLALCRAIDQPAVRAALGQVPVWDRTHALDAPPVRRAPRVRWSAWSRRAPGTIEVSPHTVVTAPAGAPRQLRDPRDGELRCSLRPLDRVRWLHGERLLALPSHGAPALLVWDAWGPAGGSVLDPARLELDPGEGAWLTRLPDSPLDATTLLASARQLPVPPELLWSAGALERVHGAPDLVPLWSEPEGDTIDAHFEAWASGGLVAISRSSTSSPDARLFERDGFALRWQREASVVAHDEAGTLLFDPAARRALLVDPDGTTRWGVDAVLPHLLAPTRVVARSLGPRPARRPWHVGEELDLVLLDRATGQLVANLGFAGEVRLVLVRDTLAVGTGFVIRAFDLEGGRRWELDLRAVDPRAVQVVDVAPLPGALVVAFTTAEGGGWVCLEEAP